jgi:hypothetical protein
MTESLAIVVFAACIVVCTVLLVALCAGGSREPRPPRKSVEEHGDEAIRIVSQPAGRWSALDDAQLDRWRQGQR